MSSAFARLPLVAMESLTKARKAGKRWPIVAALGIALAVSALLWFAVIQIVRAFL